MGKKNKTAVQKRLVATRMDRRARQKLEWLWPERIALGTLTVLAGGFQSGKSLLAADLVARVSRGDAWPDGRAGAGPSEVLVLNHEDSTLMATLEAAGADMGRVVALEEVEEIGRKEPGVRNQESEGENCGLGIGDCGFEKRNAESAEDGEQDDGVEGVEKSAPHPRPLSPEYRGEGSQENHAEGLEVVKRRPVNLKVDLAALDEYLAGMEHCKLVVIDPVDAHFTGGNSVAARMWLRSLMLIAAKHQVAMVLVTVMKEGRKSPLYRLAGGLGLAGAARNVWAVVEDPKSEVGGQKSEGARKLFLSVKNNMSREESGLAFRLEMDERQCVPRVEWTHPCGSKGEMGNCGFERGDCGFRIANCGLEIRECKSEKEGGNTGSAEGLNAGVECLGIGTGEQTTESTKDTEVLGGGDAETGQGIEKCKMPMAHGKMDEGTVPHQGVEGVEGLGRDAEGRNAEDAEEFEREAAADAGTVEEDVKRDVDSPGGVSRAKWIALREQRRKLAEKKRRMRKEKKRQRRLQKPR